MVTATKKELIVNEESLHYYEWYSGTGRETILLLHGWRSQSFIWFNIAGELAQKGFRVFAVDLPGFGHSGTGGREMWLNDYAMIVSGFLEKLQLKNIVLVGHSFGARVVIRYAASDKTKANKIVIVASGGFHNKIRRVVFGICAKFLKPFFSLPWMSGSRIAIYRLIGAEDYVATPNLQKTLTHILNEDVIPFAKSVSIPTLIVWGARDKVAPISFGNSLHDAMRNSRMCVFADSGHFPFIEEKDRFLKLLFEFINEA